MYPTGNGPWIGDDAGPRYASVWLRIAAYIIDGFVLGIVNAVARFLVLDGIYIVSQEASCGQTLGKRAVGTKVVMMDGGRLSVRAALVRYVFLFFAFVGLGGIVTLLTITSSPIKQRMGDRAAGTIVIKVC